jgi:hypothetical protein
MWVDQCDLLGMDVRFGVGQVCMQLKAESYSQADLGALGTLTFWLVAGGFTRVGLLANLTPRRLSFPPIVPFPFNLP